MATPARTDGESLASLVSILERCSTAKTPGAVVSVAGMQPKESASQPLQEAEEARLEAPPSAVNCTPAVTQMLLASMLSPSSQGLHIEDSSPITWSPTEKAAGSGDSAHAESESDEDRCWERPGVPLAAAAGTANVVDLQPHESPMPLPASAWGVQDNDVSMADPATVLDEVVEVEAPMSAGVAGTGALQEQALGYEAPFALVGRAEEGILDPESTLNSPKASELTLPQLDGSTLTPRMFGSTNCSLWQVALHNAIDMAAPCSFLYAVRPMRALCCEVVNCKPRRCSNIATTYSSLRGHPLLRTCPGLPSKTSATWAMPLQLIASCRALGWPEWAHRHGTLAHGSSCLHIDSAQQSQLHHGWPTQGRHH
jgi:hypothetical protein